MKKGCIFPLVLALVLLLVCFTNSQSQFQCSSSKNQEENANEKDLQKPSFLFRGSDLYGDSEIPDTTFFPCWFNYSRATFGQSFAKKNFPQIANAHVLSLLLLIPQEQMRKVLYSTHRSNDPQRAFKRYVATGLQVRLWYTSDLLSEQWLTSIRNVRRIHKGVSHWWESLDNVDFSKPVITQEKIKREGDVDEEMWEAFDRDLQNSPYNRTVWSRKKDFEFNGTRRPKYLFNSFLMTLTQWSFVSVPILFPAKIGIPRWSTEELKSFAHLWSVISYGLGMDENFIICKNVETSDGWKNCLEKSREIFEQFMIPSLFQMDFEARVMVEALLMAMKFIIPAFPPDFLLVQLLEDLLDVPARNLRKRAKWQTRSGRFLYKYVGQPFLHWPSAQRIANFLAHGEIQIASKKVFGDPGNNSTSVAHHFYFLEK